MVRAKSSSSSSLNFTRTMVWVLLFSYGGLLVVRSTYQNYAMKREIDTQKARILMLEKKKREDQLALVYYRSNAFKEIEARRRLNLKGPDEKVVVLPESSTEVSLTTSEGVTSSSRVVTPAQSWWQLFFPNKKTP